MIDENLTQSPAPPRNSTTTAYIQGMTEVAAVPEHTVGKTTKIRPVRVEIGIYRHPNERTYHERPFINGKQTWRSLGVNFTPQHNLAGARDEFRRRRAMQAEGKDPYAPVKPEKKAEKAKTVGDLIRRYGSDGYLDKHLLERPDSTRDDEKRNCDTLLLFWDSVPVDDVKDRLCDDYRDQRVKNVRQGEGLRTTDRELNTLNNVFKYCKRRGLVRINPIADRPKYQPSSRVHHCREYCPRDADELHAAGAMLFKHPNSVVVGFHDYMKTKNNPTNPSTPPAKPFKPTRLSGFTVLVEASNDGSQMDLLHDQTLEIPWNSRCTHMLVVGKSGSGKTTRVILPMIFADIADPDRSVFVLDAQAEEARRIIEYTRRVRGPDARILYINLQDPQFSVRWNPFGGLRRRKDADDIADTMSASVDQGGGDSPYFRMQARKYLSAFIRGMNNSGDGPATGGKLLSLLDGGSKAINNFAQKTKQPELLSLLANLQNGNRNDETSLSELNNLVGAFNDEDAVETTSRSDFDFGLLDDEPCVVILSIPEESVERLRPTTNAFIDRLCHFTMERGRANGGALRRPLSLFMDEFASAVGRIPNFQKRANTLRKRGLAITVAVQTMAQIHEVYRESAQSLIAAFNHLILVSPVAWDDAVQASNLSGVMTVDDIITSDGNTPVNVIPVKRPVLTPEEIANPSQHKQLGPRITFLLANTPPFQGWLRPAFEHPEYQDIMATTFTGPLPLPVQPRSPKPTPLVVASGVGGGGAGEAPAITDTAGWGDDDFRARLEAVKQRLGWNDTTGSARKWWEAFENENQHRLALVLRLAEELLTRKATITEFFLAYVYSNTDNIQANLHYLDYTRLKKQEGKKRRPSSS